MELQFLVLAAERRNCVKGCVRNRRCMNRSDFETHLYGVMGEYAVSKLLDCKMDMSVSFSGDDKISDFVHNGWRIQVKTRSTSRQPIYLYFNTPQDFRADLAISTCVKSPTIIEVLGWITRDEFLERAKPMNFGYGPRIGVTQQDTLSPKLLGAFVALPPKKREPVLQGESRDG